jgi:hypothetical protein
MTTVMAVIVTASGAAQWEAAKMSAVTVMMAGEAALKGDGDDDGGDDDGGVGGQLAKQPSGEKPPCG